MSTLTKEWLQKTIAELEEERDATPGAVNEDAAMALAAMKLALASLEAEPVISHVGSKNALDDIVAFIKSNRNPTLKDHNEVSERLFQDNCHGLSSHVIEYIKQIGEELEELRSTQDAYPPAPVSVPEWTNEQCLEFLSIAFRHAEIKGDLELDDIRLGVKMVNGSRAAMLQGADRPQNEPQNIPENIPATQFKPVADLYGLTSPTGGETSFTFDAVEARDFIDGGWSCQEYVELERFQEAITNHTEDKLAMGDHSGDSNNMVEPVTTACKLRDAVDAIRNSGIAIDAEKIFAERDALNAPDCWCRTCRPITLTDMRFVVCPECGNKRCPHANDHRNACTGSNEPGQEGSAYPAAPQQEVK